MGTNYQVWIFVLLAAFSAISWAVKKLQEQAAIKAAQEREARRSDEILRTGRDPQAQAEAARAPGSLDDAQARLRELAQRRQAQLRELRKREQAQGQQGAPPPQPVSSHQPSAGPVTAELWPGGPVIVLQHGPAAPAAPQPARTPVPGPVFAPQQRQTSQPRPARAAKDGSAKKAAQDAARKRALELRQAAERQRNQQSAMSQDQEDRATSQARAAAARPGVQVALQEAVLVWTPPQTANAWRDAFIAAEVLGPPVSLRE